MLLKMSSVICHMPPLIRVFSDTWQNNGTFNSSHIRLLNDHNFNILSTKTPDILDPEPEWPDG